jgi:riboflavin synthase
MFTGIIERVGRVAAVEREPEVVRLSIETGFPDLVSGESVAVNGVCLTVAGDPAGDRAAFFASRETLARTNLGSLDAGVAVNLERALTPTTRLSGHLVQGHVDGLARLISVRELAGAHELELELPAGLSRYCVEKGSIALDGVSLTLNAVHGTRVAITLIPHSWANTRFAFLNEGDLVNVEVDLLAKYVEKLLCK